MNNVNLKTLIEFVGISAIVLSLVFVGLQLRQSQEIAIAAQYQARAEAAQSMWMSLQESGTSVKVFQKPNADLTPADLHTIENVTRWGWTQYDNHFFQYQAGFLDEESWQGLKARVERIYSNCDRRPIWQQMRQFLRPSFVQYVDDLNDTCSDAKRP